MKLTLISEATIQQIEKRIPLWAKMFFGGDEQQALKLLPDIIAADPTKGKYSQWLIQQHKNKTARFPEDTEKLAKNLSLFHQKKSKLANKDINSYTPAFLAKTLDQQFGLTNSERRAARKGQLQLPPGATIYKQLGETTVVKITDPDASSYLCSGTEWCTANKETAIEYLDDGPLYLFYVGGERNYLAHIPSEQYMDIYDNEVDDNIRSELMKAIGPEEFKSSPERAVDYAKRVIGGKWPELLKDPWSAYLYAKDVIGGRWPEAESIILKDPQSAFFYAKSVIGGRWPEAEPIILKDPKLSLEYAKSVIGGRWPEAEPIILKDPWSAFLYAMHVIGGRWPEAESIILKDPWPAITATRQFTAFVYTKHVIGGRWPEAEPIILKDPKLSIEYAKDFIGGKWPEAEPNNWGLLPERS